MSTPGLIKVVVFGLGAVGKSALSIRFVNNTFVAVYDPTIENVYKKTITVDNKTYSIDLLDTAGMEQQVSLQVDIFRQRDCFILVYAIDDRASFDEIQKIHNLITRYRDNKPIPCILCANKSDLGQDRRQVETSEGQALAKQINAVFLETSALTGQNVDKAMEQAVLETIKYQNPELKPQKRSFCLLL